MNSLSLTWYSFFLMLLSSFVVYSVSFYLPRSLSIIYFSFVFVHFYFLFFRSFLLVSSHSLVHDPLFLVGWFSIALSHLFFLFCFCSYFFECSLSLVPFLFVLSRKFLLIRSFLFILSRLFFLLQSRGNIRKSKEWKSVSET